MSQLAKDRPILNAYRIAARGRLAAQVCAEHLGPALEL